ncbi:heme oxygenase [Mumia flava]|uniref:Heme oxygenase n=1 Tax=Mumia flava TaxID=1348852 RepID=A0A0B2BI21_9ACTN|nr:biliverdin-producing heme oxygenase [Mumia flava]PJJ58494.1 heme oxygenase [Mumia flava]
MTTTVAPLSLSTAMREGSAAEHKSAESSTFMADLLAGRSDVAAYGRFLRQLAPVYDALETVGRSLASDRVVAAVHDPALDRLPSIESDLRAIVGDDWAERVGIGPAARAYADRVLATAGDPVPYLAHHYTRYLGDLSGGQAIGRILQREYGVGADGTSFYAFDAVPKPKPYKDAYRARLDGLGLSDGETARVVDEVRAAFACNEALFAEMSR